MAQKDCGTIEALARVRAKEKPPDHRSGGFDEAPGSDLLSHGLSHTTIGASAFHFRVRDGIGWYHAAVSAREAEEFAAALDKEAQRTRIGTWDVTCVELSWSDVS